MQSPERYIPEQHTGISKEKHHDVTTQNALEAEAVYQRARRRLLDVNAWASIADGISAKFLLCDAAGNAMDRPAQQWDLVRIDLPGPRRNSGSGFDWVSLDIAEGMDADGPWIVLTTRPTSDPFLDSTDTAHFFSEASTGTFVIRQNGNKVQGSHYGRNETPNTDGSLIDETRAVIVTIGAYLGLSDIQWSNLVKGLLEKL